MARKKKVVVVGGGTGTYQVLTGLKAYSNLDISAVIAMTDSGGSTGRLRRDLGILPPGDIRRAVLALSDVPFAHKTLEQVFDFRFKGGKGLQGHSLGNILLAALIQITGSMDKAIVEMARILNVSGTICPVTLDKTHLVAVLEDATRVHGETNIDMRDFKLGVPIKSVYLNPKAKIFNKAREVLKQADLIVLGPGDLYTSVIPVLLVHGVNAAILSSKARLVYLVNLMTKRGETDDYTASKFVAQVKKYLGKASSRLNTIIVNKKVNQTKSKMTRWYKRYGSKPVQNDIEKQIDTKILAGNYVDSTTFVRHNPKKIAKAIVSIL